MPIIYYKGVRYDTVQGIPWTMSAKGTEEISDKAKTQPGITPQHFSSTQPLRVTTNGTYNAPSGTAYDPVQVDVNLNLRPLTVAVTANGTQEFDGQFDKVTVSTNIPQQETDEIEITRPGVYTPPTGKVFDKVTVTAKTGNDAKFTTNGQKAGMYYEPTVLIDQAEVTYVKASQTLKFEGVDMRIVD